MRLRYPSALALIAIGLLGQDAQAEVPPAPPPGSRPGPVAPTQVAAEKPSPAATLPQDHKAGSGDELTPVSEAAASAALSWPGRRFAWYDYSYTGALAVGATVELLLPVGQLQSEKAGAASHGVLFDGAVREALVLGAQADRHGVGMLSNVTLGLLVAYPLVIDGGLVSWAIKDSPDVAWQSTMINIQAFAFTSLVTGTIKRAVDRQRPIASECQKNPEYDSGCATSGQHYSFPSGHTSMAFTGASLICLHHAQLGLYGRAGDTIACASGMLAASITGWSRIASDKHFLTDVLAGATIGGISGGLLPWLLYYQFDVLDESASTQLVPSLSPDNLGLRWAGRF